MTFYFTTAGESHGRALIATIEGLQQYELYSVKACASNGFGVAETRGPDVWTYVNADAPPGCPPFSTVTLRIVSDALLSDFTAKDFVAGTPTFC